MPPRIIVRIELPKKAWDTIGRLTEKFGMTQVAMLSRMVEWLCAQPDEIKGAVLGGISHQAGAARLILKNMRDAEASISQTITAR